MAPWRIDTDISETLVRRDEKASLRLYYRPERGILRTAETLVRYRFGVVALAAQKLSRIGWQILVELDCNQSIASERNYDFPLENFGGVGEGSSDIVARKLGIGSRDLFCGHAVGDTSNDNRHRDAGAFDASVAVMYVGIYDHPASPIDPSHLITSSVGALHRQHLRETPDHADCNCDRWLRGRRSISLIWPMSPVGGVGFLDRPTRPDDGCSEDSTGGLVSLKGEPPQEGLLRTPANGTGPLPANS